VPALRTERKLPQSLTSLFHSLSFYALISSIVIFPHSRPQTPTARVVVTNAVGRTSLFQADLSHPAKTPVVSSGSLSIASKGDQSVDILTARFDAGYPAVRVFVAYGRPILPQFESLVRSFACAFCVCVGLCGWVGVFVVGVVWLCSRDVGTVCFGVFGIWYLLMPPRAARSCRFAPRSDRPGLCSSEPAEAGGRAPRCQGQRVAVAVGRRRLGHQALEGER
jgi:hypothetical protein